MKVLASALVLLLASFDATEASAYSGGVAASRSISQAVEPLLSPGVTSVNAGRSGDVRVYHPQGVPRSVVIFLSGEAGWRLGVIGMARQLAAQGALVIGVDTPRFIDRLDQDKGDCEYPGGDLDGLGHFVQAYYRLPNFTPPILAGYSSGASLAYAVLAQTPKGTFAGALLVGFRPQLHMNIPLCEGGALKLHWHPARSSMDFVPPSGLPGPLDILEGDQDSSYPPQAGDFFTGKIPGIQLTRLRHVGHGYSHPAQWRSQYVAAFDALQQIAATEALPLPPLPLRDLPLLEVSARPNVRPNVQAQNTFAVLMTGDGGWSGFEEKLAEALAVHGIPVVGMDTLRYFWSPRTPAGAAADLDRVVRYYIGHWSRSKVLLLGYSQGADVLPFMFNRLPAETRQHVLLSGEIGLGDYALFAFHQSRPGDAQVPQGLSTTPEMQKLENYPVLCIYGAGDSDSPCPHLDPKRAHLDRLAGGHDAGGDSQVLAKAIINAAHLD